ncbi:MAG: PDZ domain-containing protein [Pirellulales bacterium]|nr:PDZ domain-containing protein [Pirellulales bacterium]
MRCLALVTLCTLAGWLPGGVLAQDPVERMQRDIRRESGEEDDSAAREPGYLGLIGDAPEQNGSGVQVREIYSGGPADLAGIKPGDIILLVAERNIGGVGDLGAILTANQPGSKLIFTIQREENEFEVMVTLGRRPNRPHSVAMAKSGQPAPAGTTPPASGSLLGLRALPVTESVALSLGLPRAAGALVTRVVTGSPAELAGIPEGAVIVALDGKDVADAQDLADRVRALGPGKTIDLAMYLDGKLHTRQVRLGSTMQSDAPAGVPGLPPEGNVAAPNVSGGPQLGTPSSSGGSVQLHALEQKIGQLEERLARIERLLEQILVKESVPAPVGEIDIDTVETTAAPLPQ